MMIAMTSLTLEMHAVMQKMIPMRRIVVRRKSFAPKKLAVVQLAMIRRSEKIF